MKKENRTNGFTLLEGLIALLASVILYGLIVLILQTALAMRQSSDFRQDEFAILQLRQEAALSLDCHVEEDQLIIEKGQDVFKLSFEKNRLVKKKGYQILMEGIEDGLFYEEQGSIYMVYEKQGKSFEYQIV